MERASLCYSRGTPQITHVVCVSVWTAGDLMWFERGRERESEPKLVSNASHRSTALPQLKPLNELTTRMQFCSRRPVSEKLGGV